MTLLPNDIIDKSRFKNLNKLLKEKGIISQVIESEEKNIIGVSLGYTKKLLQKSINDFFDRVALLAGKRVFNTNLTVRSLHSLS